MEAWICGLFSQYLEKIQQTQSEKMSLAVDKAKKFIKGNYKTDISLSDISKALGYSPNYLGHNFKVNTGHSISEYIQRTRIGIAKELLKNTVMKTYEIAFDVGFKDHNYFCTVFKKITGLTPKEFKNI